MDLLLNIRETGREIVSLLCFEYLLINYNQKLTYVESDDICLIKAAFLFFFLFFVSELCNFNVAYKNQRPLKKQNIQ